MSNTEGINRRNKQIEISNYIVSDMVAENIILSEYIPMDEIVADFLTKALSRVFVVNYRGRCQLLSNGEFNGLDI